MDFPASSPSTLWRRASTQAAPCGIGPSSRRRLQPRRAGARDTRSGSPCRRVDAIGIGRPRLRHGQNERGLVVGRKNWLFYGTDTHAEAAAAIFSIIATCRLHGIDPFVYFDEVLRVLPYWPQERYLDLAPQRWLATRATLQTAELERPLSRITVPPPASASAAPAPEA